MRDIEKERERRAYPRTRWRSSVQLERTRTDTTAESEFAEWFGAFEELIKKGVG